ncbi:MAG: N-acetyl sugar amidotransferase [Leuconostoc mesenteroides]
MNTTFQVCNRCVMDNSSDNYIEFDSNGYCNYCNSAFDIKDSVYFPNKIGEQKLYEIIKKIKKENKNKQYDCLMGISGGLDSAYLAYLGAVKWGLRIYAIHIDDGFNEPIAESNIKKLCEAAKIELRVEKPDKEEFEDLTRSFIKANVPNLAIPQDNVLFAYLYKHARKEKIKYFLSGGNFSLENILQKSYTFDAMDKKHIQDIHNKYGKLELRNIEFMSHQRMILDKLFYRIKSLRLLNYINYNKEDAIQELSDFCNFEYYGSKHLENKLTKFVQLYWFVNKCNLDKRKSHLSSLIVSGQISRDKALEELDKPLYDNDDMDKDIKFILDKLNIRTEEFEEIIKQPITNHEEYKTSYFGQLYRFLVRYKQRKKL